MSFQDRFFEEFYSETLKQWEKQTTDAGARPIRVTRQLHHRRRKLLIPNTITSQIGPTFCASKGPTATAFCREKKVSSCW
jgi:hypothetical protein